MKRFLLILSILLVFVLVPASTTHAANPLKPACDELSESQQKDSTVCSADSTTNPLFGKDGLLNKITRGVAAVAGSVAIILMIIGGYKMMLSNSDKAAFASGRSTLIYAAVGLAVIVIAQALIGFIITRIG